ncbi:hypothetical protein BDR26DRAFT_904317 [Obelidium mucronatum]|nr:hypothetical protein BDR26DRAFT_904317 [Obelidium mucronatum]
MRVITQVFGLAAGLDAFWLMRVITQVFGLAAGLDAFWLMRVITQASTWCYQRFFIAQGITVLNQKQPTLVEKLYILLLTMKAVGKSCVRNVQVTMPKLKKLSLYSILAFSVIALLIANLLSLFVIGSQECSTSVVNHVSINLWNVRSVKPWFPNQNAQCQVQGQYFAELCEREEPVNPCPEDPDVLLCSACMKELHEALENEANNPSICNGWDSVVTTLFPCPDQEDILLCQACLEEYQAVAASLKWVKLELFVQLARTVSVQYWSVLMTHMSNFVICV